MRDKISWVRFSSAVASLIALRFTTRKVCCTSSHAQRARNRARRCIVDVRVCQNIIVPLRGRDLLRWRWL
jgi:hypothetical protein